MKRIGNFLFVEQCYKDADITPQAVIAIDSITCICSQNVLGNCQSTIIELSNESKLIITGEHDDNIIMLSKLLEKPTTINQTFDSPIDNIDINFEED